MATFRIDVVLDDGSVADRYHRIVPLADACKFAFSLADDLSLLHQPKDADVRWVQVYDEHEVLVIAIQIIPGEPLAGASDRRSRST